MITRTITIYITITRLTIYIKDIGKARAEDLACIKDRNKVYQEDIRAEAYFATEGIMKEETNNTSQRSAIYATS